MIVVVPLTVVWVPVLAALDATGYEYYLVDVSDSDESYWSLLAGLWRSGDSFAVVEHDVIVEPGSIAALDECAEPWCAFAVRYGAGHHVGLGCAKFTSAFCAKRPTAMGRVGEMSDAKHPQKHWCRLDAWLSKVLAPATPHVHWGPLDHLRDDGGPIAPSHGCLGVR